jgi:hypothetical protein
VSAEGGREAGDRCFTSGIDPNLKVGGGSVVLFTHDELATDPSVMRHDCAKIGQLPWLPHRIVGPEPIGHDAAAHRQVVPRSRPRGSKSQGAGHRWAAARQSPAGPVLEPVRPETADDTPRDLTSTSITSRPDNGSWDFNGNEQDFGEDKNPPKPHANP